MEVVWVFIYFFFTLGYNHIILTLSENIKFICTRCETGQESSSKARFSTCFYRLYTHILSCSPRVWSIVGSSLGQVKPKTIKLVNVLSPLRTWHWGERTKTGWLGIRIMCPSGDTCLSVDCCQWASTIKIKMPLSTVNYLLNSRLWRQIFSFMFKSWIRLHYKKK